MGLKEVTDRQAVPKALQEFDAVGRDTFRERYGFGRAKEYFLVHDGRRYDSKAIVGAAHGYQHAEPMRPAEFSGGANTVVPVLEAMGFDVVREFQG